MNYDKTYAKKPNQVLIEGTFLPSAAASLDLAAAGCTQLDTVIETSDDADAAVFGTGGNATTITITGTATYADALADCGVLNTKLDTVIDLSGDGTLGSDGNAWIVRPVSASANGSGLGCTIRDDAVNEIVYIFFEEGVTTVGDVETALGTYGGVADVESTGTGANILAGATDMEDTAFSTGADAYNISVSGNDVTFNFTTGVTTVANFETAIGTLAATDEIIKVKTSGTGGNVLVVADDALAKTNLSGGYTAEDSKVGQGFTVARASTGVYTISMKDLYDSLVACNATLQMSTGADKFLQFGDYSASGKTISLRVWDVSGTGVADVDYDANNRFMFSLAFQR